MGITINIDQKIFHCHQVHMEAFKNMHFMFGLVSWSFLFCRTPECLCIITGGIVICSGACLLQQLKGYIPVIRFGL